MINLFFENKGPFKINEILLNIRTNSKIKNLDIIKLKNPNDIIKSYKHAANRKDSKTTILVEYGDYYNEK